MALQYIVSPAVVRPAEIVMREVPLTTNSFDYDSEDDPEYPAYEYDEGPDEGPDEEKQEYYRNLIDWQAVRNDKKQRRITAFFRREDDTEPELNS